MRISKADPSATAAPDTYRSVRVVVNGSGVTPHYRHGYRLASPPHDEGQFRRAVGEDALGRGLSRLAGGAPRSRIQGRIVSSLKVSNSKHRYPAGAKELSVSIAFDPMRIAFASDGKSHRAGLYLAVLVDDAAGEVVGELTRPLELALASDEFALAKKHWLSVDVTVPIEGNPARVRAAVYDYDSDRTIAGTCAIQATPR
ncbi:MAG TPA: hypothetical protein VLD67_05580 [Vicinamibacterales bacterium]|nr:hypothetical protein [Vicinamibacterales bacterium]